MEFGFDDHQLAIRGAVRSFCDDRFGLEAIARREGSGADPEAWKGLAELGVLGMLTEGTGTGMVEASLVFEQLGSALVSGPVLWSTLAAPIRPAVTDGTVRLTGIEIGEDEPGPFVVEHLSESDELVLLRSTGVEVVAAIDPTVVDGSSLDPLTPVGVLHRLPRGEALGGPETAMQMRRQGCVLAAAMLVGVARAALQLARDYALEREQFGVPIGSFQAIKHILADMYVRVELAQAATYAAAAIPTNQGEDLDKAVAAAKLLAGEAAIVVAREAVQVLGGMGFTWEMLPHYYLKRAWMLDQSFGTVANQSEHLASLVADDVKGALAP